MISEEASFLCRTFTKYKLLQFLNDILTFYKQEMFDETSVTKNGIKTSQHNIRGTGNTERFKAPYQSFL